MTVQVKQITVTLTGATGSAVSGIPFNGLLRAVHINYVDIAAATTDVTIKCLNPDLTLLAITDSNTDAWYYPRITVDTTGGVDIAGSYDLLPIFGTIEVSVAQADAGSVIVTLLYDV
jgi:hypothetical protein